MGGPRIERPFTQYEILGKGRSVHQWAFATQSLDLVTSLAISTAAQEAHENRPPYYALYFLMKLE